MKFLVDRCAGNRIAVWLQAQGHDVAKSWERGPDPGDRVLLDWAVAEKRIFITMDKDFGEFLFVQNRPHCGLVRLPDVPTDERVALMSRVLIDHERELAAEAIITVRGGRIRISHRS